MLLAGVGAYIRIYQGDFLDVETAGRRPQRHLLHFGLHAIEHKNESRALAEGNVELGALISVDIQEKSSSARVAVTSVVDDEGVFPNVRGLHQPVLLILVAKIGNARHLRILATAAVHKQLGVLRLRRAQYTVRGG